MTSAPVFTPAHLIDQYYPLLKKEILPENCVLSLLPNASRYIRNRPVKKLPSIFNHPLHLIEEPPVYVLAEAGLGAPAAAMTMELFIELGCRTFIIPGTCGILNRSVASGHIILPNRFICEEGTSGHYLEDQTHIKPDPLLYRLIETHVRKTGIPCHQGLHWTTDAPFRETGDKIDSYREKGCLSVDMETSALLSIGQHHRVKTAAILITADVLSPDGWIPQDHKQVSRSIIKVFSMLADIFHSDENTF